MAYVTRSLTNLTLSDVQAEALSIIEGIVATALNPVAPTDLVSKAYVDAFVNGASWKEACDLKTVAILPSYTVSGLAGSRILQANSNGALTIDGILVQLGYRILVDQTGVTLSYDAGIYRCIAPGGAGSKWQLQQQPQDAIIQGSAVQVLGGATAVLEGFVQVLATPVLDTDPQSWVMFAAPPQSLGTYSAVKTYNTADYVVYNDVLYKSLTSSNLGNQPNISPVNWEVAVSGSTSATSSATANTVAKRGASSECAFGALTAGSFSFSPTGLIDGGNTTDTAGLTTRRVVLYNGGVATNLTDQLFRGIGSGLGELCYQTQGANVHRWYLGTSATTRSLLMALDPSGNLTATGNITAASVTAAALTAVGSISGGSTVDLYPTSATINVACGSGVQTLNVGVSGGGATAINLGGSNDTVTLGGSLSFPPTGLIDGGNTTDTAGLTTRRLVLYNGGVATNLTDQLFNGIGHGIGELCYQTRGASLHRWYLGTSATTRTQLMSLDASGNLVVLGSLTPASLVTNTITGGSTVDLFATSSTINVACGSGVQTVNFGVSGGGATAINLGGSNDTVTLGGTTAANGALTITSAAAQLKLYPSVLNGECDMIFNTATSGGGGTQWFLGQGSYGSGAGNFGIGVTGANLCFKITNAGAISTPYSFAATGTVTGSNITTLTSDVAANKATVTAATSSATVSTLAMRGAASECSFGALTASAIQLTAGAGASKVLTSDASGNGTWQTPTPTTSVTMGGNVTGSSASCSVVGAASGFAVAGTMSSSGVATLGGLILPTTGGASAATLSYYEDSFSWTFSLLSPLSSWNHSATINITRIGNLVSFALPVATTVISADQTNPYRPATSGDYIPSRFRPSATVYVACIVQSNSVFQAGMYTGNTDGSWTVAPLSGAFSGTGSTSFYTSTITYHI